MKCDPSQKLKLIPVSKVGHFDSMLNSIIILRNLPLILIRKTINSCLL